MKIRETSDYIFITIESHDWKLSGRRIIEDIKNVPGRIYNSYTKSWKIEQCYRNLLPHYLSPFTPEEELEGRTALREFLDQFEDDTSYNL